MVEMETRQQRRAKMRELTKLGQAAVERGLAKVPKRAELVGLALVLRAKLADKNDKYRASAAAALAHRAYEAAIASDPPKLSFACRKGCSYCCHGMVTVTAPEAFRLARLVGAPGSGSPSELEFMRRAALTAGLSPMQRLGRKLACPFLAERSCSVYASRPLICRQLVSLTVEPCIEEYEGKDGVITMPRHLPTHAGNVQLAMLAALRSLGHAVRIYELSAAVLAALASPEAEERWCAGADIFHALAHDPAWIRDGEDAIETLAAELAP
jgi:Putative zinc- or iron-chelating domain